VSAEDILMHLDRVRGSNGRYTACCPAHDDKDPSLSITETSDRKVLLKCFSGCTAAEIVGAIGLELKDLFPPSDLSNSARKQYAVKKSRAQITEALHHELVVMLQIIGTRMADNQLARDSRFREARPEWRPMPADPWDREILAAKRIRNGLEALYE
jgi:DNA primase